ANTTGSLLFSAGWVVPGSGSLDGGPWELVKVTAHSLGAATAGVSNITLVGGNKIDGDAGGSWAATDHHGVLTTQAPAAAPGGSTTPANLTVTAGQTASFTAAASGSPTPTVQWQVSTDGGATFTDVPGATAGTLSFTAALADNSKQFHAVFTNTAGTATSTAAT